MAYENLDYTHLTPEQLRTVQDIAKAIRNKAYGVDVREAMARALEIVSNAISLGGGQESLQLSIRISDLSQEVKEALTGGAVAVVGEGAVNTVNVVDEAVTSQKINGEAIASPNILDTNSLLSGQATINSNGKAVLSNSANWLTNPNPYPVSVGDILRFNEAFQYYYYGVDDNNNIVQTINALGTKQFREVTVATGVTGFYTNVFIDNLNSTMITLNANVPSSYVAYTPAQKELRWLKVSEANLNDDLLEKVNKKGEGEVSSDWYGKRMITAGDSITYEGGWQAVVTDRLGVNVNNIAIAGRSMSDGTTNGAGTVTTITGLSKITEDLFVIAAGTNDFKLNAPIGELKNTGETFDRNTFYGAYQTALEHIINKRPDIRIVLFTPLHRDNSGYNSTTFTNSAGHKLIDYVEAIKVVGARYSVPVCDMYSNSGINILTLGVDTRDGLHPNDVGYSKMGNYASKFINNI